MNDQRYKQFVLESEMIERSSALAVEEAHFLNEMYVQMSDEEIIEYGEQLITKMQYWENRLLLEDRIMKRHLEKYKDLIDGADNGW